MEGTKNREREMEMEEDRSLKRDVRRTCERMGREKQQMFTFEIGIITEKSEKEFYIICVNKHAHLRICADIKRKGLKKGETNEAYMMYLRDRITWRDDDLTNLTVNA
ncbi:hypothetical protein KFK09_015433 [Dendrobium nobile]|uniref:Uncharacterized protein n=1 Tax=Dendrobium nobile TaxID=94219 RepID=A0A8T3B5Y3_DENNO|nr:hypothetical protein KFK09_015433 [Dendrobium nobile]